MTTEQNYIEDLEDTIISLHVENEKLRHQLDQVTLELLYRRPRRVEEPAEVTEPKVYEHRYDYRTRPPQLTDGNLRPA